MSKSGVRDAAIGGSLRFNSGHFNYSGVDGRVYHVEKDKTAKINPELYNKPMGRPGAGFPSLVEVYRCEYFLTKGLRYRGTSVSPKQKNRIIAEYGLVYMPETNQYVNNPEYIWQIMINKFGAAIANRRITSYDELVYRSKYAS